MIATLLPLALLAARPPQPLANPTPATIRGQVVRADGRPIVRAQVPVQMVDGPLARATATTDDGSFQIPMLLPGRYRVTVSRAGYVTVEYGQRQPTEPGQVLT